MEDQLNPPPHIILFNDNNPAAPTESFSPHYHESFMIQPTTLNPDHNQGLRLPFMLQGETTVRETQHSNLGFFDLTATAHHPFNSSSSLYSLIHPFFGVGSSNGTLNNLPSFHQESHSLVLPSNNSINCYPQAFNGGPLYDEKWHHPTPPPNQLHMINHSEFTSWKDHDHLTTTGQDLNSNPTWMQQDGRYDDQSTYNHNHTNNQQLSLSLSSHNHPSILSGLCLQQDNSPCSADNHQLPSHSGSATTGDVSLSSSSNGNLNSSSSSFSQILVSKSKYLGVIQEILSDFATFSLENMEDVAFTTTGGTDKSSMHHSQQQEVMRIPPPFKGFDQEFSLSLEGGGHVSDANVGGPSSIQKKKNKAKKAELLALLQMVDDCYNQSLDEIHTVISAFHAATELDPQIHACSALQTISVCYKSLKEKISNQILKMGPNIDCGGGSSSRHQPREGEVEGDQGEVSFEKSFLQKQWALQQLRRRDQLWRPQRGLPERSVSVLRAWMFQNFLHPYPKDSEKHLLAIKSGLTRSQVSNWFINARVRLWKPLIEEMYSELNRRKARQSHDGSNPTAAAATGALSNRILNMN